MNKAIQICLLFLLSSICINYGLDTLVGQKAPRFSAQAVIDGEIKTISLGDFKGQKKLLIFYPADFSFICPTELKAIQEKLAILKQHNTIPLAISVDQVYAHQKWLEIPPDQGGIKGISYPLISDVKKEIATAYGALDPQKGVAFRATIIIDENDIVQAALVYNMSTGRNIDEIIRVLDMVDYTAAHGQVCPANWNKDKPGMEPTQNGLKNYLKENYKK